MTEPSKITRCEISCDKVGELYFCGHRIFRGIHSDQLEQTETFLNSVLFKNLLEKQWIPKTWVCDEKIDGFDLVLEHENIHPHGIAYEWSPIVLKNATRRMLEMMHLCLDHGYIITDPHVFNVVNSLQGIRYLDFGSFQKIEESSQLPKSYRIFYRNFILPLLLTNDQRFETARSLFLRRSEFPEKEIYSLLYGSRPLTLKAILGKFNHQLKKMRYADSRDWQNKGFPKWLSSKLDKFFSHSNYKQCFNKDLLLVEKLNIWQSSQWAKYQGTRLKPDQQRFSEIIKLLKELGPFESMVDLAGNEGVFSQECIESGVCAKSYCLDLDSDALSMCDQHSTPAMMTFYSDLVRPDGRLYDQNIRLRVKSPCVVALAITHHLFLSQGYPWQTIIESCAAYTSRVVCIEYMPLGLYDGNEDKLSELPEDYKEENFETEFLKLFKLIKRIVLGKNRVLYVGELKEGF